MDMVFFDRHFAPVMSFPKSSLFIKDLPFRMVVSDLLEILTSDYSSLSQLLFSTLLKVSYLSLLSRHSRVKWRPHIRDALGSLRLGGEIPSWTPSEPVSEEISCCLATLPSQSLGRYFAVTSEAKRQFSPDRAEILGIPFFSIGKGVCKVSEQWHISFLWNSRFTCFAPSS